LFENVVVCGPTADELEEDWPGSLWFVLNPSLPDINVAAGRPRTRYASGTPIFAGEISGGELLGGEVLVSH
jgi:hypothetical protein